MNGPQQRVAFFSNGHIGNGHSTRYAAINRALVRADEDAHSAFFAVGPFGTYWVNGKQCDAATWREQWRIFNPTLAIVDGCERHFVEVVGKTKCPLWALVRATTPEHFENAINVKNCQRVISIEPCARKFADEHVEPIVLWEHKDLWPPEKLRDIADLNGKGGWIGAVVHAGVPGEIDQLPVDFLKPCSHIIYFDWHAKNRIRTVAAPYLTGAARIVGAAGYNFFWETHWLGLAHRVEYHPLCGDRIIDDQGIRIYDTPTDYMMRENGADQLARLILEEK